MPNGEEKTTKSPKSPKDLCNLKEVEKQVSAPQKCSRTWIGNTCRRHFWVTGNPKHQRVHRT